MSYGPPTATRLYKYQWDYIHDPQTILFAWAEEEEEGAAKSKTIGCEKIRLFLEDIHNANISDKNNLDYTSYSFYSGNCKNIEINGNKYTFLSIEFLGKTIKDEKGKEKTEPLYIQPNDKNTEIKTIDKIDYIIYKFFTLKKDKETYSKTEEIGLKIMVKKEESTNLENYLFVTKEKFIIEITENGTKVDKNRYVHITAEPKMPKIVAKVTSTETNIQKVKVRLKIEYGCPCFDRSCGRDRNDIDWYPSGDWKEINIGSNWEIDFENKIRGGKATLYVKSADDQQTFVFYIRGTNPTKEDVINYAKKYNTTYWFFTRIIRHETGESGTTANQFKPPNSTVKGKEGYGPEWENDKGCPNQGSPCGWGISQLDDPKPDAEALWNWKYNIDEGKNLLDKKIATIRNLYKSYLKAVYYWDKEHANDKVKGHPDQIEGNITFTHASSSIPGLGRNDIKYTETVTDSTGKKNVITTDMGDTPTGDKKSFIDATLIKLYNGGYYYRLRTYGDNKTKPEWYLDRTSKITVTENGIKVTKDHNYVEKICTLSE